MFKTEFANLRSGEIFRLPTSYSNRVDACVCGQNYVRDRQQEDGTILFFRVVTDLEKHDVCKDCKEDCFSCGFCEFVGTDDEEPEHGESVYGNAEETPSKSLAEILSEFSANRPIY